MTAGTATYGLTELGGLVAGDGVVVIGPGPIGLLGAAMAKALGASPVILVGTSKHRLDIGLKLGADHAVNIKQDDPVEAVQRLTGGQGVDYVLECSGAKGTVGQAVRMLKRGGKVCLAAFPKHPEAIDIASLVRNNVHLLGIRGEGRSATHRAEAYMRQGRFDASLVHTHTFPMSELPEALRVARERVDNAIEVVVRNAPARPSSTSEV